jgi:hypothetical protein
MRYGADATTKEELVTDKDFKAMTIRLPADQAADLEAVARVDRVPVAEAVRAAIAEHIAVRREDGDFRERLQQLIEENREILERLAR